MKVSPSCAVNKWGRPLTPDRKGMSPDAHGTTATAFSERKKPDPKGHPVYDSMYVTSWKSHSCRDLESAPAWGFGPREELTPVDRSVGACMVWWGCVCICENLENYAWQRGGRRPEGQGSQQALASTGPSRWTSSPSICFLLTLLFFIIVFYMCLPLGSLFFWTVYSRGSFCT